MVIKNINTVVVQEHIEEHYLSNSSNCCIVRQHFFLFSGDEILAVNGQVCHDISHAKAVNLFKSVKSGPITLHICRRKKSKTM